MIRFIGPVRATAFLACVLVTLWVLIDVNAIRLTGQITSGIQHALEQNRFNGEPFFEALRHPPLIGIVHLVLTLGGLVLLGGLIRFAFSCVMTSA